MKFRLIKNKLLLIPCIVFAMLIINITQTIYAYKTSNTITSENNRIKEASEKIGISEESFTNLETAMDEKININDYTYDKYIYFKLMAELVDENNKNTLKTLNEDNKTILNLLLDRVKIVGDSQVTIMKAYNQFLSSKCVTFGGKTLKEEVDGLTEEKFKNTDIVVFFNGYNIGKFASADEYTATYEEAIKKLKGFNPNMKIFITSLLPARADTVINDLNSAGEKHHYENGPIFDEALSKKFTNLDTAKYINTKWALSETEYDLDGVHASPNFYKTFVPYITYYIQLYK